MNVLITGGTSGIGKAIKISLIANRNAKFIDISSRNISERDAKTLEYTSLHINADLRLAAELENLPYRIKKAMEILDWDNIDLIVNNAGFMSLEEYISFSKHNDREFRQLFSIHFLAPLVITEAFVPQMKEGLVVNIASVSGITGEADLRMYAAAKAALINLTKSHALMFAKNGVRVNSISPGFVDTNLVPGATPVELLENLPIPSEIPPQEIARVVEFLIDSPHTTGANIVVDGGKIL